MQQKYFPDVPVWLTIEVKLPTVLFIMFFFQIIPVNSQEGGGVLENNTYIFRSVEEAMTQPDMVFRLNLSKAKLETFPAQIFLFKNLEELDLSRNKLEEVPAAIGRLVHLKKLNLANNKLVHLPDEIGELKELVFLGLNRNELEDLPLTIGHLHSLEVFELWDNELKDLPDEISELQNLKMIELRGILFTDEQQKRIDELVIKSAKIYMSPSCNCKN